jgi:hypothetical protein
MIICRPYLQNEGIKRWPLEIDQGLLDGYFVFWSGGCVMFVGVLDIIAVISCASQGQNI